MGTVVVVLECKNNCCGDVVVVGWLLNVPATG